MRQQSLTRDTRYRLDLPPEELLQPWLSEKCWGTLKSFGPGHCKARFKWISMSALRSNWGTCCSPLPCHDWNSSYNKEFPVFIHQRHEGVGVTPFPMFFCPSPFNSNSSYKAGGEKAVILNLKFTTGVLALLLTPTAPVGPAGNSIVPPEEKQRKRDKRSLPFKFPLWWLVQYFIRVQHTPHLHVLWGLSSLWSQ